MAATILLVDDDPEVLEAFALTLEDLGYDVTVARSGQAALDILDEGRPLDLLLTDIRMPGLDGFDVSRLAKARRPELKVLYLTGYGGSAPAMRDPSARLGKILPKPIRPDALRSEIDAALAQPSS
jgi:CheY-like chemotaxis protein